MTNFYNGVLNHAQLFELRNNTSSKGCKLCNQVFISTQALLVHLESHMAQEEIAIKRLHSLPQHVNSQKQLGFQLPIQPIMGGGRVFQAQPQPIMETNHSIRRNPVSNASQIGSSSVPIRRMQVPSQLFPYGANINDDGSKAYILKLEKPIKKIDFIDLVNTDDDNNSEVEEIDLNLKL
ncbi:hypothetical protein LR48_Vigan02g004900 [Vigna angularis]|uniref:C2H2-type domain-containing protein n=1 Tax=Phaseolus angularis TaxID=3914 RepID=A0A0L9TUP8_PHAAN|nr:uncharacterized protein HKW66_Vig0189420 [Vigna angularis]KOM33899.1 hypothetical protein LR48_Vigan02g004900 [Vigna angularis]